MKRVAVILILALANALAGHTVAQTIYGAMGQSSPYTSCPGGYSGPTCSALAIGATMQRISTPISIPFTNTTTNTTSYVSSDVLGCPCSGMTSLTFYSGTGGWNATNAVTSPVIPGGTTVHSVSGGMVVLNNGPNQNVYSNTGIKYLGAANVSYTAGNSIELQIFNSCTAPTTGSCAVSNYTDFAIELNDTLALYEGTGVNIIGFGCENELDINGNPSTVSQYLMELTTCVNVGHTRKPRYKVWDGGITTGGLTEFMWAHHFYNIPYGQFYCNGDPPGYCNSSHLHLNTSANMIIADQFANIAYLRNAGQANFQGKLPTSCQTTGVGPGGGIGTSAAAHLQKVEALLNGYPGAGIDYVDAHLYGMNPQAMTEMIQYIEQTINKQAVGGEMGSYTENPVFWTAALNAATYQLGFPWLVAWNSDNGSGGGGGNTVALINNDGTPRPNGTAFKTFVHAPTPSVIALPVPQPPC